MVGAGVVVVVAAGSIGLTHSAYSDDATQPTDPTIKQLVSQTPNPNLSPDQQAAARALLDAKAKALADADDNTLVPDPAQKKALRVASQQDAASQANARSLGVASDDDDPGWEATGIYADGNAPMPATEFVGINHWSGSVDGVHLTVYAGEDGPEDASTGKVVIQRAVGDDVTGSAKTIAGSGELRVTAYSSTTVTMVDAHGGSHVLTLADLALS
jgi:hypothetical protein